MSVFVALSLHTTLGNETGRYVPDAWLETFVAPEQYVSRLAYLWDDERSLGKPRTDFSPATAAFQAGLSTLGAKPWLIERLTHALYLSLAALGVILLMRAFRPRIGLEHAIAAFVYTFSPFTTEFLLPAPYFLAYALAPWFAWIALRGVRDGDPWRWAAALALAIAAVFSFNAATLGFALIPAALIALYFSLYEGRGLGQLWGWVWRAGLLSALTCSAGLVVLWYSGPEVSASLRTTELPEVVGRTSSWFESWRGLGFWATYTPELAGGLAGSQATSYFTQAEVIAASFVAALGALLALALGRWRYRLLFGSILVVSLVLMVGTHEVLGPSPFGRLLSFAFGQSDIALGFRNTYKAGAGLMLAIAVLLGVGVSSAVAAGAQVPTGTRPPSRIRALLRPLLLGLVVPIVVAVGVVVASFPFWTDRLYPRDGFENIPRYWDRTFNYLGGQDQPGRVLVLPGTNLARYRWGHAQDGLFDGLSPVSPVSHRFLPQGTAESDDLVATVDEYASSPGYIKGTLGPILARLGVRWVLLQNDLDWQRLRAPRPSSYDALRDDPDLRLAARFGRGGENTASQDDLAAGPLGEDSLSPVELYEVAGKPSPNPRLTAGPPRLVAGAGDSWPSLATAGLLGGPPVAYTGAAQADVLGEMVASGSDLVVTDGNRRRATQAGAERTSLSPTLAANEPQDRAPDDLFGSPETQSTATYADAAWISASRYGFPLGPYQAAARPANAFDGIERTAWTVRGTVDPGGESITVELRKPETITEVSVLPHADGRSRVKALDVIMHFEHGGEARERLPLDGALPERARARIVATEVKAIELRIAEVGGPEPVGLGGVGIAEIGVETPDGPLDLREFVRTPDDLAVRAARDSRLGAELAARPPRYELRRVTGIASEDEETELRREITTFGDHRYRLSAIARTGDRSADSAIDALLGATVGAVGTSRLGGHLDRRGGLVVDDELSTGWEPEPNSGETVDVRFPAMEVRTVEVLVVSGPPRGVARSRVTDLEVAVAGRPRAAAQSSLPRSRRCARPAPPPGGCLETHVVRVPPTRADRLSVALTGIEPVEGRFGPQPPKVVEVRVNGGGLSGLAQSVAGTCAPLFAVDGRAVGVRLPKNPVDVLLGKPMELKGCEPVRLGPGRHRIESLPGLSGAVLTTSLVPVGEDRSRAPAHSPGGKVELVDRSPTELDLRVDAPEGALLVGGMPSHQGWGAEGGDLRRTPVPLDTFAAWTVVEPTAGPVTLRFGPQRIYELAIALSLAAAAWCLWRVTRRRSSMR